MKRNIFLAIIMPAIVIISCTSNESTTESGISTPEAQGISSVAILDFIEALEEEQPDAIHSFMLRRHGKIVAQGWWSPYNPDSPHMLFSLSKSFTSTAIGIAQDEGLLRINDPVISFFPDDLPEEQSDNLKAMRIKDLLKMNSGHEWGVWGGALKDDNWVKLFLAEEVKHKPGTHFVYNTGATYMLSAIIQKVTGQTLNEYLKSRLYDPLDIEYPYWETCPKGISMGGTGLYLTTEDISKLGQLYLQKGIWNGRRLVSEAWIEEATSLQTSNGSNPESDWEQGYGYQFWRCRHDLYRGDGAHGQFCIVMPKYDAVLAITSGTDDMQGLMNLAWKHLLPSMEGNAIAPDEEQLKNLNDKLGGLKISCVEGESGSKVSAEISGKRIKLEPNEMDILAVTFDFKTSPVKISIETSEGVQSIDVGFGKMELGEMKGFRLLSKKVAACGAWETPQKFVLNFVYYETPFAGTINFQFVDGKLFWDTRFAFRDYPQLIGKL